MSETVVDSLSIELEADIDSLRSDLADARRQLGNFGDDVEDSTDAMTEVISKVGKAIVTAFAVKSIINFGRECIELASDLNEVQNVVDVTFGSMADQVNTFAVNAMTSFGLSEKAAKQYIGTMGAMLQSMGMTTDTSLEMSTTLTALSSDLASFYNLTNEEAFTKIRSGISGETEPLKQLGINMSVANLEAYALANGVTKAYSNMSSGEQTILRYNYLLETTAAQQGDFSRTSESWANSTKTLAMRFDELKARIGQELIPALEPLLPLMHSFIDISGLLFHALSPVLGLISGIANAASWLSGEIGDILGLERNVTVKNNVTSTGDTNLQSPIEVVEQDLGKASDNAKGVAQGIKDATSNAKALQKTLSGFDDANVLSSASSGGTAASGALKDLVDEVGAFGMALQEAYGGIDSLIGSTGNLSDKWGMVSLNADQVRRTAANIIKDKNLEKCKEIVSQIKVADGIFDEIVGLQDKLNTYNWLVKVGVKLTEEEMRDYRATIEQFIAKSNEYFENKGTAIKMSMAYEFGENSDINKQFNAYFDEQQIELKSLQTSLQTAVEKAFEDGILSVEEAEVINDLTSKINAINQLWASAEQKAKLDAISVEFEGLELNSANMKALNEELDRQLEEATSYERKIYQEALIGLYALLDGGKIDQTEFERQSDIAYKQFQDNVKARRDEVVAYKVKVVARMSDGAKIEGIEDIVKETADYLETTLSKGLFDGNSYISDENGFERQLYSTMSKAFKDSFDMLDDETKDYVNDLVDTLEPDTAKWLQLAQEYADRGEMIPDSISDSLTNTMMLKALTGDIDAIYYLMGNQLNGTAAEEVIKTAKKQGLVVPESIILGMSSNKKQLDTSVTSIFKNIETSVEKALQVTDGKSARYSKYGEYVVNGFVNGIKKNVSKAEEAMDEFARKSGKAFTNVMQIKSPSRLFGEYAENTIDGYDNSIVKNMYKTEDVMSRWGSKIATWGQDFSIKDVGFNASVNGDITSNVTGNIESSLIAAMNAQNNNFYAEITFGGEKFLVELVKKYNQMHASNPNIAFNN